MMRRGFLLALTLCSVGGVERKQSEGDPKATLVYIGTYTRSVGLPRAEHRSHAGQGIYVFRLQSAGTEVFQNVTLIPRGLAAETPNPSSLELDLKRRLLFAVNEIEEFEGNPTGAVSAFAIDPAGKLTLLNQRPSMGTRPCQLVLDKEGRNLLVANCGNGSVSVVPVAADGRLGEATDVAHAHDPAKALSVANGEGPAFSPDFTACITLDPASRFAFACEPRSDRVLTFQFDAQRGKLTASKPATTPVKSGADPRQMLFRQDGRFAYVLNGGNSTVTARSLRRRRHTAGGSLTGATRASGALGALGAVRQVRCVKCGATGAVRRVNVVGYLVCGDQIGSITDRVDA